jgi:hypothetical protein
MSVLSMLIILGHSVFVSSAPGCRSREEHALKRYKDLVICARLQSRVSMFGSVIAACYQELRVVRPYQECEDITDSRRFGVERCIK